MAETFGDQDPGREEGQASRDPALPLRRTTTKPEPDARLHLCRLPGLFALAQLMAQTNDEQRVLRLAGSSIPSLGPFRLLGIHVTGEGWHCPDDSTGPAVPGVDSQLPRLASLGGLLSVAGQTWAWAFGMRCQEGQVGFLAVSADTEPAPGARLLVGMLAQQTAIAVANARLRRHASELQKANTALATAVSGMKESGEQLGRR